MVVATLFGPRIDLLLDSVPPMDGEPSSLAQAFAQTHKALSVSNQLAALGAQALPELRGRVANADPLRHLALFHALASLGDPQSFEDFVAALQSTDSLVRAAGMEGLRKIATPAAFEALKAAISAPDPVMRQDAMQALGDTLLCWAPEEQRALLLDPVEDVRSQAAKILFAEGSSLERKELALIAVRDCWEEVRKVAALYLARFDDDDLTEVFLRALEDTDELVAKTARRWLLPRTGGLVERLVALLPVAKGAHSRREIANLLKEAGDPRAVAALREELRSTRSRATAKHLVVALGALPGAEAIEALVFAADYADNAVNELLKRKDRSLVPALEGLLLKGHGAREICAWFARQKKWPEAQQALVRGIAADDDLAAVEAARKAAVLGLAGVVEAIQTRLEAPLSEYCASELRKLLGGLGVEVAPAEAAQLEAADGEGNYVSPWTKPAIDTFEHLPPAERRFALIQRLRNEPGYPAYLAAQALEATQAVPDNSNDAALVAAYLQQIDRLRSLGAAGLAAVAQLARTSDWVSGALLDFLLTDDSEQTVEALVQVMRNSGSSAKARAAERLMKCGGSALNAIRPILAGLPTDPSKRMDYYEFTVYAARVLAKLKLPEAEDLLLGLVREPWPDIQKPAIEGLAALKSRSAVPLIAPFLSDRSPVLVRAAIQGLRRIKDPAALPTLEAAVETVPVKLRPLLEEAIKSLGR